MAFLEHWCKFQVDPIDPVGALSVGEECNYSLHWGDTDNDWHSTNLHWHFKLLFFLFKKIQNLFKNSDVLDGDQKYKKCWTVTLASDTCLQLVMSFISLGRQRYTQLRRSGLSDFFLGRNNRRGLFLSLKGDKWKRRVTVPVISKVCSCQRRVLSKDRRRQKFKGCSQTLCVSWWKLYHPTKTQDNFNAYDKSFFVNSVDLIN